MPRCRASHLGPPRQPGSVRGLVHKLWGGAARRARRHAPWVAASAVIGLLALGRFRRFPACGWTEAASLAALLAGLAGVLVRRARRAMEGRQPRLRDDLELGLILLTLAESVSLLAGGLHGPFYPIVYLVVAFLVAFLRPAAGVALAAAAIAIDLLAFTGARALPAAWPELSAHAAFLALFALLYQLVLAVQVAAARRAEGQAVARRLLRLDERAREYRLIAAGSEEADASPEGRARWTAAAVREVEQAVGSALEIAERALHAHTCAVFLLSADDRALKLHDCRSRSEAVRRDPLAAESGVLGAAVRWRKAVRLSGRLAGVTYYDRPVAVRALLAVPLLERRGGAAAEGFLRGVVVADRIEDRPFTPEDEDLLAAIAREVLRAIEAERLLGSVKRARDEKERFYRAIDELNRLAKPEEVFEAALALARSLLPADFAALTLVEGPAGRQRIAAVAGVHAGEALAGRLFAGDRGLCGDAIRYGTVLPASGVRLGSRPVVFDEEAQLRGAKALKVFPLRSGDRILGTLVAASRRRGAFDVEAVQAMEVIALQVAQAIQRAQLFSEVERMATTDGLTGLVNHRQLQLVLGERLAEARRYRRPLSLLLGDIDHFKAVNDTHGHPAGDAILRGVAEVLSGAARETDVVARYGGEEFVLVLPETDATAAGALAERVRAAVEARPFPIGGGTLRITLSLGIATFPEAAADKAELIARADAALYAAKHAGRNRAVAAPARGERAAG